jgi:hypothetical protein
MMIPLHFLTTRLGLKRRPSHQKMAQILAQLLNALNCVIPVCPASLLGFGGLDYIWRSEEPNFMDAHSPMISRYHLPKSTSVQQPDSFSVPISVDVSAPAAFRNCARKRKTPSFHSQFLRLFPRQCTLHSVGTTSLKIGPLTEKACYSCCGQIAFLRLLLCFLAACLGQPGTREDTPP